MFEFRKEEQRKLGTKCSYCEAVFDEDEDAIVIQKGKATVSAKSGRIFVMPIGEQLFFHPRCFYVWISEQANDEI